jgi:hypothetical protein
MPSLQYVLQRIHQTLVVGCAFAVGWVVSEMWRASRRESQHSVHNNVRTPVEVETIQEEDAESEEEEPREPSHALKYAMQHPDCGVKMVFAVRA